jgi:hypothetical protein
MRIHRPNSVEPYRGILVQRCRPSLCLYRVVFGITAKESRPASVELMSRCWRSDSRLPNVSVGSLGSQRLKLGEDPAVVARQFVKTLAKRCVDLARSNWDFIVSPGFSGDVFTQR